MYSEAKVRADLGREVARIRAEYRDRIDRMSADCFLEAIQAWLADTESGNGYFDEAPPEALSCADVIGLLHIGVIYE